MKILRLLLVPFILVTLAACETETGPQETTLSAPSNIEFDGRFLSWDDIPNAAAYELYLNGDSEDPIKVQTSSYNFIEEVGDVLTVQIKTIAIEDTESNIYNDSSLSTRISFRRLDSVTGLQFQNGIVTWNSVDNATGYEIEKNGVLLNQIVENTEFEDIDPGSSNSIRVRPVSDESFYSYFSNEIVGTPLTLPIISFDNSNLAISWEGVSGAEGYSARILLNGSTVYTANFSTNRRQINDYSFTLPGNYIVQVQSKTTQDTFKDSKYSEPFEIIRLSDPQNINVETIGETDTTSINFNPVSNAISYTIIIDDVETGHTTNPNYTHRFPASNVENIHVIRIIAKGNNYNILNSPGNSSTQLTKLSSPLNIRLDDYILRWDSVSKNNGYQVSIDGTLYESENNELDLRPITSGRYTARIRAKGNNNLIISSDFSNSYEYRKLERPLSHTINDGTLTWDPIEGALQYKIMIDEEIVRYVDNNSFLIDEKDINESTTIQIIAMGNANTIDSDAYDQVKISRLRTPVISINDGDIIWNPIEEAEGYRLIINSREYFVEGSSFNTDDLTPGDKNIRIIALGDNKTTFNSEVSTTLSVRKLDVPNLSLGTDRFLWGNIVGSEGYEIIIGSEIFRLDRSILEKVHVFNAPGEVSVKLKATGNNIDVLSSSYDELIHTVTRLSTPSGTPPFTFERNANTFKFEITTLVPNAKGYVYNIGGVEMTEAVSGIYDYSTIEAGTYNIQLKATADQFYYHESNYSESIELVILAAPNQNNIRWRFEETTSNGDGYLLSWDAVSGAISYDVEVEYVLRDGTLEIAYPKTNRSPSDRSLTLIVTDDVASVNIKLTSVGNNTTIFDSKTIQVTRIPEGD